jgi:hypothetical protein
LDVYDDALSLIGNGHSEIRDKIRTVGAGKNKTTVTDHWDVEGLEGLMSAEFYGPQGSGSHQNSKSFVANPINAVVVKDDPFKANNPDSNTLIILTNGPVNKPLVVYEAYDARSEIENALFREAKQAWFIERPPINTKSGFIVHVYLTIFVMALTTAFRDYWIFAIRNWIPHIVFLSTIELQHTGTLDVKSAYIKYPEGLDGPTGQIGEKRSRHRNQEVQTKN